MNAIYLHPSDGFTFLENVPEKPIRLVYGFNQDSSYIDERVRDYERALAEAKKNGIKIDNPEEIYIRTDPKDFKEGELYPWPGTWEKKLSECCNISECQDPGSCHGNKCLKAREVVILSPPKENPLTLDWSQVDTIGSNNSEPLNSSMSYSEESHTEYELSTMSHATLKSLVLYYRNKWLEKTEPVVSQDQRIIKHPISQLIIEKECKAFAGWIMNTHIQGRTLTKLWLDYQSARKPID